MGHHAELFISTLSDLPSELVSLAQAGSKFSRILAVWIVFTTVFANGHCGPSAEDKKIPGFFCGQEINIFFGQDLGEWTMMMMMMMIISEADA